MEGCDLTVQILWYLIGPVTDLKRSVSEIVPRFKYDFAAQTAVGAKCS